MQSDTQLNEVTQVSVPSLIRLSRYASAIPLRGGRVIASQGGNYQSPFKGRGMEFDESRLYQPGDDIRNIDWRVTARTGKAHTKLFREERERPVFVWVDLRAPMFFATRGRFKSVLAAQLASLVAWSAIHHADRVGAVIFSEDVHHELKPQRGEIGVLRLINHLAGHPAWQVYPAAASGDGAGGRALIRLRRVARPGSLIFLFSDFRNLDDTAEIQLLRLSGHNDVVMLYIHDQLEKDLPPPGQYRLSYGSREIMLDTFDRQLVEQYRQRQEKHRERLNRLARKGRIYLITCTTGDDPLSILQSGLASR